MKGLFPPFLLLQHCRIHDTRVIILTYKWIGIGMLGRSCTLACDFPRLKSGIYWFHISYATSVRFDLCALYNSKMLSQISFKLGTLMYFGK